MIIVVSICSYVCAHAISRQWQPNSLDPSKLTAEVPIYSNKRKINTELPDIQQDLDQKEQQKADDQIFDDESVQAENNELFAD